ncbi:hypothetical protein [Persicirhabdus sediminis]|uniref:Uncharacterized protein n=1 Tax=Persicirhabdus sediminis TaxID=454144 RepID=A0A8J7MK89_9BACT|nr:hypothetical protein [Persicirhabdus sediminis]MBK1792553.1 hypothetical protein [Persicirhabdus sediminis]
MSLTYKKYYSWLLACVLLCFQLQAADVDNIELSVSPSEIKPGDVIELTASFTSHDYCKFTMQFSRPNELIAIGRQKRPVTLTDDNKFVHSEVYTMQAAAPGSWPLENLAAVIQHPDGYETTIKIVPVHIEVSPVALLENAGGPEPLPEIADKAAEKSQLSIIIAIVAAVLLIATVVILIERKQTDNDGEDNNDAVDQALQSLKKGEIPTSLLHSLLEPSSSRLSDGSKSQLEHAIFSGKPSADAIIKILTKEVQS